MPSAREAGQPETVEEAARNLRYDLFRQLIADGHADSVLTAHTLDDQAETVLMKLLRGAWTEGLSGIYPVVLVPNAAHPGKILRPLLGVRRSRARRLPRIAQPGLAHGLHERRSTAFTRNRVRHSVLPLLREFNPAIDQALANLAELAREDEARWQSELGRILPQLLLPGRPVRGGGRGVSTAPGESNSVALEIDRLRALDPALRRRVVRAAARQLGVRLNFDETARLLALAGLLPDPNAGDSLSSRAAAPSSHLSGQLRATRTLRELRLFRETPLKSPKTWKHSDLLGRRFCAKRRAPCEVVKSGQTREVPLYLVPIRCAIARPLRVESFYLTRTDAGPGWRLLPKTWNPTVVRCV